MPWYTMRPTWFDANPEPSPDDYVLKVDGKDAGRCYLMMAASSRLVWRWTVYWVSGGGMEETLEEAQRRFKETYEAAVTPSVRPQA